MKKWKILLLLVAMFMIISLFLFFPRVSAITEELPLFGRVIFVDAGHPSLDKPNVIVMSCSK